MKDGPMNRGRGGAPRPRKKGWIVGGRLHANSAAQFWPGFIAGILSSHPGCSEAELSSPVQGPLSRVTLFPEQSLQRAAEQLKDADMRKAWRELLAELELMGPPSPVRLRLLSEGREIAEPSVLPEDINSETFAYLLAWLLEWAGIPEPLWNGPCLDGAFDATIHPGGKASPVQFGVSREPLAEGLERTVLRLRLPLNQAVEKRLTG